MSKKDDTIKALKKKLKKLKAEIAALTGGKPAKADKKSAKPAKTKSAKTKSAKAKPAKAKVAKTKSAKTKPASSKVKNAEPAKTLTPPSAKPEPMKIVAKEPAPLTPPARVAAG
ncbi:hypothetical protein [Undibacter mobilis]|uniref:Uncharacterized protein n=1 Tax=Undibacter mobilis TaxID=2292256 RepID=A0A371B9Z2_9BRAD|nr:hypothetical protein [Undibacter mobilis]RDV04327.1 hypothetical protein DXH78_06875 [Undibacter mobilis]